jgi:hypothetical protein
MSESLASQAGLRERRHFIGGSDARIIMGADEAALIRLWREKRGEVEPEDLSANLIVQLGVVTEPLNRTWYERNTGRTVTDIQRRVRHPVNRWMAATLDGMVEGVDAVFEAKFMLPWSFSEEAAAEKHMAQLQHNMWVVNSKSAALSIITGGGKWVEIAIHADTLYQHFLLTAERRFWRCVETGELPRPFGAEPPRPRIEAVRRVDRPRTRRSTTSSPEPSFAVTRRKHVAAKPRRRCVIAGSRRFRYATARTPSWSPGSASRSSTPRERSNILRPG